MRRWIVVVLVSVLAGCATDGSSTTTTGFTGATTTRAPISTTVPEGTTTTPPGTTTTAPLPTATTASTVTVDHYLRSALPRSDVPWDQLGDGWYVVLYDYSRAEFSGIQDAPVVLYLVDRNGDRFEVASRPASDGPWNLVDATQSAALVVGPGTTPGESEYRILDLRAGTESLAHVTGPDEFYGPWPKASLTRPTGANLVVWQSDGVEEWIERRSPEGDILAEVFRQPYEDEQRPLHWIYGHDGTFLLVSNRNGIARVSISGTDQEALWVPADTVCRPSRWWDQDTYLAACYGQGPDSAPPDEYGDPAMFYGRLWLLETDGSAGFPLTEYPDEPPFVVDFGYHDAWPSIEDTFIQWSGDCGASQVATLRADGTGLFLPITGPLTHYADGFRMIDILNDEMAIYGWEGCDAWIGSVFVTDLEGNHLRDLVPRVGDTRGVIGVEGVGALYP